MHGLLKGSSVAARTDGASGHDAEIRVMLRRPSAPYPHDVSESPLMDCKVLRQWQHFAI